MARPSPKELLAVLSFLNLSSTFGFLSYVINIISKYIDSTATSDMLTIFNDSIVLLLTKLAIFIIIFNSIKLVVYI